MPFTFSHLPATPIFAAALSADSATTSCALLFSVDKTSPFVEAVLYIFAPADLTMTINFGFSGAGTVAGAGAGVVVDAGVEVGVDVEAGAVVTGLGAGTVTGAGADV